VCVESINIKILVVIVLNLKIFFYNLSLGTIDKDVPTQSGYAFEISEPAVTKILEKQSPMFAYDVISVCRKDR